jgi:tetratricopeptide (TPR) repeat protein
VSKALPIISALCVSAILAQPALGDAPDMAAAKEHARAGAKAFDLGRYLDAAREYEAAYEAKELPALLFNIAQSYRLGDVPEKAIHFYESYLRRSPDAPNRAEVEARISELRKTIDRQARVKDGSPQGTMAASEPPTSVPIGVAVPAVVVNKAPAPAPRPIYKRPWFWGVVGGAAVAVALGVGLGIGLSQNSTTYPAANAPAGTFRW